MTDPDDDVTLPLLESACKQAYCDFIGSLAFEDDGGWSYEVWRAAWNSSLIHALKHVQE
jgi:hypothetical protein